MRNIWYILFCWVLLSCSNNGEVVKIRQLPAVYPDYTNIAIPVNIAPLNFMIRDSASRISASIRLDEIEWTVTGTNKIQFSEKKWKKILKLAQNKTVSVTVKVERNGKWFEYEPFHWMVKSEPVDGYLSYRLIEPGYEVWNKIQIAERNVETFHERILADNNMVEGSCMNCHINGNQDGMLSMFHIRGKHGGTILNRDGKLRKLNTKSTSTISNATYGNFHPSGRYAVFSTNKVIPELHTYGNKRLEVYDSASDLIVIDFDTNKIITKPFVHDTASYETFPTFSHDGKNIYFCSAPYVPLPDSIQSLKYNILKIAFDAENGTLGEKIDTLWNARLMNGSVSHLKASPDGKYLLYTVADYGTFPIWHREADLQMINLITNQIDSLKDVNANCSDTYHSWSSNSRWFVFASKRDDGIYGKPYFCYIDENGKAGKPFVLPQKDPAKYDYMLKSFNIPELSSTSVPFDAGLIEKAYFELEAESTK